MTTLVIIDMQEGFSETAGRVVEQVCEEVVLAKERKAGIVVVEFDISEFGKTLPKILDLLKGYRKKRFVEKFCDGGGIQVANTIERAKFGTKPIRFCGVNRSYCVYSTVREAKDELGLTIGHTEIAIGASWCHEPRDGRVLLRQLGRLV